MALVSPGIQVTVIEEGVTSGQGPGTVPFVLIATAQDKTTPDGAGLAVGTTKASANVVQLVTSQREILQLFGQPNFLSVGGTQIHNSPLNEYGLLAAYSYMGIANRAFVVRADIDLAALDPQVSPPTSPAQANIVWMDLNETAFGLFESNGTTWVSKEILYTFTATPNNGIGADGEYCVSIISGLVTYYKRVLGLWTAIVANHTSQNIWPPVGVAGSTWVRTISTSNGAAFITRRMDATLQQFINVSAPILIDDSAASIFYGVNLGLGSIYVDYSPTTASFQYKQYDGASWVSLTSVIALSVEPTDGPADKALWYNADVGLNSAGESTVDLLIKGATNSWVNVNLPGLTGVPAAPASPAAPQVYLQSSDPTNAYVVNNNDLWIDTDQLSTYPVIYRRSSGVWVLIDTSDQTTNNGIIFADARPSASFGTGAGINNGAGSNPDLDLDAPDPDAYPQGMLLWNTRASTMNVKEWNKNYTVDGTLVGDRWVTVSGNKSNGSPYMGVNAQGQVVVQALQAVLVGNEDLRSESLSFNLIATPGFPETLNEMLTLNVDRKETGFVLGDTPLDLNPSSTSLQAWATNSNNAVGDGPDGLVSASSNLGVYYPSCLTTNLDGANVVCPSSHMTLRTFGYNDQVAYPWFAPAGLRRGIVSNASSVGYVDAEGEFVSVSLNEGQRDVLYVNNVNSIRFIPNSGLVVWGQKTRHPFAAASDRVNVARLTNYIRTQADVMSMPYLFEPNDDMTRRSVVDTFERFMSELVTLRGVYDYLVVCDASNNTPARIDRGELWIDIVFAPTKAIEFIYIPIRIRNTGADLSI